MTTQKKDQGKLLIKLENKLAEVFIKKLPAMPDKAKEVIVKYGPYLVVVGIGFFILASIFGIITILGASLAFLGGVKYELGYLVSIVFGLVILVLEIMAIKDLFARKMRAWKLMFYISLISAVSNLLRFDFGGLIIGNGISWYVLFQIRSYYK